MTIDIQKHRKVHKIIAVILCSILIAIYVVPHITTVIETITSFIMTYQVHILVHLLALIVVIFTSVIITYFMIVWLPIYQIQEKLEDLINGLRFKGGTNTLGLWIPILLIYIMNLPVTWKIIENLTN